MNPNTLCAALVAAFATLATAPADAAITYAPYVQPGDRATPGADDQMIVAWQTDAPAGLGAASYIVEFGTDPHYGQLVMPSARVVNHYLSADPSLPLPANATGAKLNYTAVLKGLRHDTRYYYRVLGPGLPAQGFQAEFHTRPVGRTLAFQVMGDEGFFPSEPAVPGVPAALANFEARVVNTMYRAHELAIEGAPRLPRPALALNTGDNVYTTGAEGTYRDFWFPVWNADTASNGSGAPYIRSIPYYIVIGNHDIGGNGATANLLADTQAGRFSGNTDGGDALAYYNNFYFPLNGPSGVDPQFTCVADACSPNAWTFSYAGKTYSAPKAIAAFRQSTEVDAGAGVKAQIDTMGNYSFDAGNVHFVFLDANPHLFSGLLPGGAFYSTPQGGFSAYPAILRDWLVQDLDHTRQEWKVVVFHQPAFSSGLGTLRNDQMRTVAGFLEDHGVNLVFNGHEHNYQRTQPLRVLAALDGSAAPALASTPLVAIDSGWDGQTHTAADGVVYVVEGAGGNRDFDGNLPSPRGSGVGLDQDDSAVGTFNTVSNGQTLSFDNGPASWLDTRLTVQEMRPLDASAGSGAKITTRFKAKLFSFGHVVVDGDALTLYQVSEPLSELPSTQFGTDYRGRFVNAPLVDTLVDPLSGATVSAPGDGQPVLLDRFTLQRPDVSASIDLAITRSTQPPGSLHQWSVDVRNRGSLGLSGAQLLVDLPRGCSYTGQRSDRLTMHGRHLVVSLGHLGSAGTADDHRSVALACQSGDDDADTPTIRLRSATARTVSLRTED